MKFSNKQKAIVKSYLHGLVVAALPLVINGETDPKWYLVALVSAVVIPGLRALDKADSAFGLVADAIETKLPVAPKKKA